MCHGRTVVYYEKGRKNCITAIPLCRNNADSGEMRFKDTGLPYTMRQPVLFHEAVWDCGREELCCWSECAFTHVFYKWRKYDGS